MIATQLRTAGFVGGEITGLIVAWGGSLAEIPSGWVLCDGSNGTPDLRERFVIGAGVKAAGATGGIENRAHEHTSTEDGSHSHTASSDGHRHFGYGFDSYMDDGYPDLAIYTVYGTSRNEGARFSEEAVHTHTVSGSGVHSHGLESGANPWHVRLAYIMKVAA